MNNFFIRTITAAIFVSVIIGAAIWDFRVFAAVFGVFTCFGTWELYKLLSNNGSKPFKIFGTFIALTIYTITVLFIAGLIDKHIALYYFIASAFSFLVFFAELFKRSDTPFLNIAYTYIGIIYLSIPFSLLIVMTDYGKASLGTCTFPLFYFFMIWANDTFAYLVGSVIGKHRLFERISPRKSWEGAIGGLFFTIILAVILSHFYSFLPLQHWLGLAVIIVVTGNFGDLTESMLKRSVGFKDSGKFFPGHGGILDRFDSLLLSAPFVFIYMEIIKIL
jgi:phosphatidate cytidylyltransferase